MGGNDGDRLIVLSQGDGQVLGLANLALTSLLEPLIHEGLQLWGEPLRFDLSVPQPYSPSQWQIQTCFHSFRGNPLLADLKHERFIE